MARSTPTYPQTPAQVATAVLAAIEERPDAFDMGAWVAFVTEDGADGPGILDPGSPPPCGTTMCVAGWVAHVTGWTLVDQWEEVETGGGERAVQMSSSYAERDELVLDIGDVAREALGLSRDDTFWSAPPEGALILLREIAHQT
ncbi:hypothetical protein ACFWPV_09980 [Streptomyces uncialis]|uniref:hypothetical protein n=1 Tax=Streptomyces uncialis TaxID=1048205 RepID=UPI00365A5D2E